MKVRYGGYGDVVNCHVNLRLLVREIYGHRPGPAKDGQTQGIAKYG